MPEPVPRMHGERQGRHKLDAKFGRHGKGAKRSSHALDGHGDAHQRQQDVANGGQVEGAGQSDARDAVQRRQNHGDLGLVDGKVRRDGPVSALRTQNSILLTLGSWNCVQASS